MIFVIDIGNTHTVAGIFKNGELLQQWRIKTDSRVTGDELVISYHNLFSISSIKNDRISGIILSSVVPQLEAAYFSSFGTLFPAVDQDRIFKVNSTNVSGMIRILLDNPAEVGADRLVNGIAAYNICKSSTVVIDFGTAITFDCISEHGEYLGGLILPGLHIALQALTEKAAKLPPIDLSTPPDEIIGTCTVSAMKSGVMYGYGAMIEGLIDKLRNEMSKPTATDISIIATGGMAALMKPYAPSIQRVEPDLTLNGLFHIFSQLNYCSLCPSHPHPL